MFPDQDSLFFADSGPFKLSDPDPFYLKYSDPGPGARNDTEPAGSGYKTQYASTRLLLRAYSRVEKNPTHLFFGLFF